MNSPARSRRALMIVNPKCRQGNADLVDVRAFLERRGLALCDAAPDGAAAIEECGKVIPGAQSNARMLITGFQQA